jgi:hypothetical protein
MLLSVNVNSTVIEHGCMSGCSLWNCVTKATVKEPLWIEYGQRAKFYWAGEGGGRSHCLTFHKPCLNRIQDLRRTCMPLRLIYGTGIKQDRDRVSRTHVRKFGCAKSTDGFGVLDIVRNSNTFTNSGQKATEGATWRRKSVSRLRSCGMWSRIFW